MGHLIYEILNNMTVVYIFWGGMSSFFCALCYLRTIKRRKR